MKLLTAVVCASVGAASAVSQEPVFRDTPLTTELWKLVAKEDGTKTDEALESFLFDNPDLALARSADKRGGLWWAWEYHNKFALAALKAYGADPETKDADDDDNTPKMMCKDVRADEEDDSSEMKYPIKCADLLEGIDKKAEELKKAREVKEAERLKELDEDDDDDDDGIDDDDDVSSTKTTTPGKKAAPKRKAAAGDLKVEADDEDEDEDL